ncbi:MAG: hypothetical protein ACQERS_11740 [Bacteroidota bacterium]
MGRKIYLMAVMIFTLGGTVLSQLRAVSDIEFKRFQMDFNLARSFDEKTRPEYDGTPYLFDKFTGANIILKEERGYEGIPMNYNIYNDDFEFMMDGVSYALGNNNIVKYISINQRKFYYRTYTYNSAKIRGYLELIADGDYRFFKKHRVIYTEPQPTSGYVEAKPPTFSSRSPDYFIELGDGNIMFFNKLKDFADLVPGESSRIKDYIKDKRLKARREEDIIELADYLNGK